MTDDKNNVIIKNENKDVREIISKVLSDKKLSSKNFADKVYTDQPIIRPASSLPGYVIRQYREMRALAISPEAFGKSEAWLFVKQGEFMKDFEDSFVFEGECQRYYPTYQQLSDKELRGYFSWRADVRRGNVKQTSLSFAFLYIYELLNLIGAENPEHAFSTLCNFRKEYVAIDPRIERYCTQWLFDFVVYYNLTPEKLEGIYDFSTDSALLALIENDGDEDKVFDALCALSSYNIRASRLFAAKPELVKSVCCKTFFALCEYYDRRRAKGLMTKLFGSISESYYSIFRTAVFYGRNRAGEREYVINPIHKYMCKNGLWSSYKYPAAGKNTELGIILKTIDMVLRLELDFSPKVNEPKSAKIVESLAKKALEQYRADEQLKKARTVNIDIAKLSDIRRSADITRDRLIVEDECEPDILPQVMPEVTDANNDNSGKTAAERELLGLTADETAFFALLIGGGDYNGYIASKKLMLSVVCDSINEKLYDEFCDNVIDSDGITACVIEDYADSLKEMFEEVI